MGFNCAEYLVVPVMVFILCSADKNMNETSYQIWMLRPTVTV